VSERGAESTAEKYDQETHASSFVVSGNKKPPCGGSWTDSYRYVAR
jgi:hypothetical protein